MNATILFVTYTTDPTGMSKDLSDNVLINADVCLYNSHDKQNRLLNEIKNALIKKKTIHPEDYLHIWSVQAL